MSRLLTSAALHRPRPHPPARPTEPAIHTHPGDRAGGVIAGSAWPASVHWPWRTPTTLPADTGANTSSLHRQLFAAWQGRRWDELVRVARESLAAADLPARLHPISAAAVHFFRPDVEAFADTDVALFLRSFGEKDLAGYLATSGPGDRNLLADHALALHCLGALGEATFDPVAGLRALIAFAVAAAPAVEPKKRAAQLRLVHQAVHAPVYLPAWSFRIDPCGDPKSPAAPAPLEVKLERLQRSQAGPKGEDRCECGVEPAPCTPPSPCCAPVRYYVADLLELRDWTYRYKAGDLAYIEVVAAGETRERDHKMRRTRETFSEEVTSVRSLERRDHQVTERAELQREIDRQTEASTSASASVEAAYNAKVYSARLTAGFSADRSASEAIREAQQQAREVVNSAVSEVEKSTRATRSERVSTTETEKNLHRFENATGDQPKVTKYFWVTQEKRAQLFSYGKHLIAELIVPSPARLFEHLLERRREAEVDKIPAPLVEKPVKPADLAIGPAGLTPANYTQSASQYGVSNPPAPPPLNKQVSASTSYSKTVLGQKTLTPVQLAVPPDYHATALSVSGNVDYRMPVFSPRRIRFKLSNTGVELNVSGNTLTTSLPDLTGDNYVDVIAWNINNFTATLTLSLTLDAAVLAAWQQAVFQQIKDAYDARMTAYNTALADYNAKQAEYQAARQQRRAELEAQEAARNPFYNRELERTELKRAAIYLLCQEFSTRGAVIPRAEPCGFPEIDRAEAEARGYEWYFWDRLFDWQHIAYAFFDYFWNPMCAWPDRVDPNEPDALFKAFRRAGYARLLVPVSPDMEKDFLWYAATRQKWGQTGEPPLDPNDPRWRNVVFELRYANASAMTPREGHVANPAPGDLTLLIQGSDRYWDATANAVDSDAVADDIDRELLVDGSTYLIADIQLDAGSPPYDPQQPDSLWWRITLDRPYEGAASPRRLYAMGAKAVAPVFGFDLPTDLIWAGAHDACLPTYPLPPCPG